MGGCKTKFRNCEGIVYMLVVDYDLAAKGKNVSRGGDQWCDHSYAVGQVHCDQYIRYFADETRMKGVVANRPTVDVTET